MWLLAAGCWLLAAGSRLSSPASRGDGQYTIDNIAVERITCGRSSEMFEMMGL
jgi:hypothetical protein